MVGAADDASKHVKRKAARIVFLRVRWGSRLKMVSRVTFQQGATEMPATLSESANALAQLVRKSAVLSHTQRRIGIKDTIGSARQKPDETAT